MAAIELASTYLISDANLQGYYKLENVNDSGPNGRTLTNNGTVAFNAGKFNNAADTGASNTTKWLGVASDMGIQGGAGSIVGWFNITTAPTSGNWNWLAQVSDAGTKTCLDIAQYNDGGVLKLNFYREHVGGTYEGVSLTQTLTTGTWYHLAITYDGTNVRAYINGVLQGSPTAASGNGSYAGTIDAAGFMSYVGIGGGFNQGSSGLVDDAAFFSRALTASEVAMLYSGLKFSTDTAGTLLAGLKAYYKTEDVNDSWINGYNLTNNGAAAFAAGKINNAVDLERGSSQYLNTTNKLGIAGGAISIAGWIKPESTPGVGESQFLFTQGDQTNDIVYFIDYQNPSGTLQFEVERLKGGVADDRFFYATTLSTGTFYHVVLTYDGTNVRGYLNGSEMTNSPVGSTGNGSADRGEGFWIGASRVSDNFFDGLIDEVGVWNKALSTTEITDLYNSGTGQTLVSAEAVTELSISVNDTLTISEDLTGTNIDFNLSVSDALTISESIVIENLSLGGIDIFDSIIITESIVIENTDLGGIDIYDSLTISEDITTGGVDLGDIIVDDSIEVTDFIFIDFPIDLFIYDLISISEDVVIENTDLGGIDIYDDITLTESIVIENTNLGGVDVYDDIVITESVTIPLDLGDISVYEDIAITEDISLSNDLGDISVSDTITITESVSGTISDVRTGMIFMRSFQQNKPIAMGSTEEGRPIPMGSKQQSRPIAMEDSSIL